MVKDLRRCRHESDGHRQYPEGEGDADGDRAETQVGERAGFVARLDAQLDVGGGHVELQLLDTGRPGDSDHSGQADQPGQGHLRGRDLVGLPDPEQFLDDVVQRFLISNRGFVPPGELA